MIHLLSLPRRAAPSDLHDYTSPCSSCSVAWPLPECSVFDIAGGNCCCFADCWVCCCSPGPRSTGSWRALSKPGTRFNPSASEPAPQAIVVLSSPYEPPRPERPFPVPDHETVERCAFAAWLHQRWPALPVLACGGGRSYRTPNSTVMRELLRQSGVPDALIWTEERSLSTYQNALYGAAILRERGISRIALVVDARSMLRASACFRKQGIPCSRRPLLSAIFGLCRKSCFPTPAPSSATNLPCTRRLGLAWY